MAKSYTMKAFFDTHVHVRWNFMMIRLQLKQLVRQGIRYVIIEPNPKVSDTQDGIYNRQHAEDYLDLLNAALEANGDAGKLVFLVAIKLTPDTTKQEIIDAAAGGFTVWKVYAGITTGSKGLKTLKSLYRNFDVIQSMSANFSKFGPRPIVVQNHAESPDPRVLILDKEYEFHGDLRDAFTEFGGVRFCIEHISDRRTLQLVEEMPPNVRGGLTPQHKFIWMNDIFYVTEPNSDQHPGLQPPNFFLPCAKRYEDMMAIRAAGFRSKKFHLGSDKAPHDAEAKLSCCGAAGADPGEDIISLEATAAEEYGFDQTVFEEYTSLRAAEFYGVELDSTTVELARYNEPHVIPKSYEIPNTGGKRVLSFWGGREVYWRVHQTSLADPFA